MKVDFIEGLINKFCADLFYKKILKLKKKCNFSDQSQTFFDHELANLALGSVNLCVK
jgi:hypothetical protein